MIKTGQRHLSSFWLQPAAKEAHAQKENTGRMEADLMLSAQQGFKAREQQSQDSEDHIQGEFKAII